MKNGEMLASLMQWCCDARIDFSFSQDDGRFQRPGIYLEFSYAPTGRKKHVSLHDWNHLEYFMQTNRLQMFAELVAPELSTELKGNAADYKRVDWGGVNGSVGTYYEQGLKMGRDYMQAQAACNQAALNAMSRDVGSLGQKKK